MKHLATAVAAFSILVSACAAGSPGAASVASSLAQATPTVGLPVETQAATPTANAVTEAPTEVPTEVPTQSPEPELTASVTKGRETIRACDSGSYVRAMIVVEVINEGNGWAELSGGDYTVYDANENVVGTGSFLYSYPKYLAPGATGYLADGTVFSDTTVKSVKRVEADGTYGDAAQADVVELKTAKVSVKREAYGDGLYTTGTVTNTSSIDVDSAHVASFFLDAGGKAIGFSYTNLIDNLRAGKTKGFETTGSWCPVNRSAVKKTVTIAADDDYR